MKVVIFEDEKHNAERLIQLLGQVDAQIEILEVIESVARGVAWLQQNGDKLDLAFMDIQLSDGNCFEIFEALKLQLPIIFTTAYDNFALQAFQVHSVDYLLKPVSKEELERALSKFRFFSAGNPPSFDLSKIAEAFYKKEHTRFLGKTNSQLVTVKASDIAYVYTADGFTKAVTFSNQKTPLDYSLEQMEKMLNRTLFFRINRKMIIHIDAIRKINTYYNSRLALQLAPAFDAEIVISRERVASFKNWLEGKELSA
ncbi:LytTR family DNA-binding domain-containing protein [Niabella terrae]